MSGDQPVLLDATLRPSPPMPARTLKIVVGIVAALNLAFAAGFVLRGAWPIMPFMGLDVLLLAWAFRASLRAARRHERVTVTPSALRIERHPADGPVSEVALNPYWVRVEMPEPAEHGSQLTLWSHGRGVRVGSFMAPEERAGFARSLKAAIRKARETR